MKALLREHPALVQGVPLALTLGDPASAQCALFIAEHSRDPAALEAVNAFSSGDRGSRVLREHATALATASKSSSENRAPASRRAKHAASGSKGQARSNAR
jgi:hypothetical protein